MITILSRIKKFPLENEQIIWIKQKLGEIYNKVGDFQSALNTIQELKKSLKTNEIDEKLLIAEASSNIAAGEYERGKEIINNLLTKIEDVDKKYKLIVERAYADFELGRYDEATVQSDQLLNEKSLSAELEGRCYNLKGMINIYQNNDLESALENFQRAKTKFDEAGLAVRVSGIDVNIGNVYNILAKYEKAEEYWNKASKINQSTGNLDQEGYLHQNFGMFYLERQKYESAIESFTNAQKIFLSYGKKLSYGLVLINLGETYMKICEYEKSLKNLNEAVKLLEKLENNEEAAEALFLLALVYYNVGFSLKVEEKILLLEKKLQKFNLSPKYSINLNFIKILLSFLKGEELNLEDISKVEVDYKSLGERNFMIDARFILIEALIGQEKYLQALEKLLDAELIDLCSQNSILEAKREYFLGLVSGSYASDRLLPPLVHFEKAYELINNEHISELIWKVLFSISELYINRGNLNKAKRYVIYARELIYFIAERIESPRLRAAYLRHKERITTLQKLESFYPTN
jgi:tetratricopeptide (TPR) repeat protein